MIWLYLITLNWKSRLLIAGLKYTQKHLGIYLNCFWFFFNLYITSENTWRLCTNHGWFWIQFTVNCAFEIMIKILCHWTVTKRPMNLRMNLLHTCDVMYNLYTSQLLSRLDTVPWSIFYWGFQPLLILWIEVSYLEMKKEQLICIEFWKLHLFEFIERFFFYIFYR